ncbi:MAG TPA: hypothetical protein VK836_03850 [Streptosporangiaceae bacterium]|nr:hypothetical protein [Streptosporangiaceae bacterium]
MFPTFPYLSESIAAERAADLRREAAAYRRTRGIRRSLVRSSHAGARPHARRSPMAERAVPQPSSCAGARVG